MKPCCEAKHTTKRTVSATTILGILAVLAVLLVSASSLFARETTAEVKVWGNCKMCKKTIEKSLSNVNGVKSAAWNKDTKILTVNFDDAVISQKQVEEKVAAAGYDTQNVRANDEAYKKLHDCCQYERKK